MDNGKQQNAGISSARSDRPLRHEVSIPATIIGRESAPVECEIRDLSSTGMSLAMQLQIPDTMDDPLGEGCKAEVAFTPDPEHAPADKISLPVQIMWRHPQGVGIRFLKSNNTLRAALSTVARNAVDSRLNDLAGSNRFSPAEQRKILSACRKSLENCCPTSFGHCERMSRDVCDYSQKMRRPKTQARPARKQIRLMNMPARLAEPSRLDFFAASPAPWI